MRAPGGRWNQLELSRQDDVDPPILAVLEAEDALAADQAVLDDPMERAADQLLGTLEELVTAGKIRAYGGSHITHDLLLEAAGRYGVYAKHVEAKRGEHAGKKFDEIRHYATLVCDVGK